MSMIDDIKSDMESGTDGFYWNGDNLVVNEFGVEIELFEAVWVDEDEFEDEHKRRIARVPGMEAALLAADEMATDFMITIHNIRDASKDDPRWLGVAAKLDKRLAAYRKSTEAAE